MAIGTLIGISGSLVCSPGHAQYHSETRTHQAERQNAESRASVRSLDRALSGADDVADVLDRIPEVRVRRSGGSGNHAYVSIRGSESTSVGVFLDGMPLNSGHQSSVSLNLVLPELLRSVEVYRSNTPIGLAGSFPGGAVHLRLRRPESSGLTASVGYGSFGTGKATLLSSIRREHSQTLVALAWRGTRGDFRYFNNNGTDFNTSDDNPRQRRINNEANEGSLFVRHELFLEQWNLTFMSLTDARLNGVPGLDTRQAEHTSHRRFTQGLSFSGEGRGYADDRLTLRTSATMFARFDEHDDRRGEIGLGTQHRKDRHFLTDLGVLSAFQANERHRVSLNIASSLENYRPNDLVMPISLERAFRATPSIALAWDWSSENSVFSSHARVQALGWFENTVGEPSLALPFADSKHGFVGGQAGFFVQPDLGFNHGIRWATYGSRTGRAPDFAERFGDEGSVVGNPDLTMETQWQLESSVLWKWDEEKFSFSTQVAGFYQWRNDAIEFNESPIGVHKPFNVDGSRIGGLESALAFDARFVGAEITVAQLWTENLSEDATVRGNELPWRSPISADGVLWGSWRGARLEWSTSFDSSFYADSRNRRVYPSRWMHDARLSWRPEKYSALELSLDIHNITNERHRQVSIRDGGRDVLVRRAIADYTGYPLPGRAVYGTLTWRGQVRKSSI